MKLRKKGSKRRFMSFEKDIVDDVFGQLGGAVSKAKIRILLKASISYALDILYFTDCTEVFLPYIGRMRSNFDMMKRRRDRLLRVKKKRRILSPDLQKELDMLEKKLPYLEGLRGDGRPKDRIYSWCKPSYRYRYYLSFMDPFQLEGFQNKVFDETI